MDMEQLLGIKNMISCTIKYVRWVHNYCTLIFPSHTLCTYFFNFLSLSYPTSYTHLIHLLRSKVIRQGERWVKGVCVQGCWLTKNYPHNCDFYANIPSGSWKVTSVGSQPYAHLQSTAANSFGGLRPVSWWSQEKTSFSPSCYLSMGWKHHSI